MKHVIVLNQFAIPRSEGGGTRHIDLFGRLDGWTPLIVAGNRANKSQRRYSIDDRRFRLVWVPEHHGGQAARVLGWVMYALQAFTVTITRRQVDVVYGSSPHLLAPLAGLVAARLRSARFVLEVRDPWPESIVAAGMLRPGSRLHRALCWLERVLARGADAIVVVTPGWEAHFAEMAVPTSRLTVISNGAEPDDFAVSEPKTTLRAEYGIDGFTAIYAGAHGPANDLDLLLDAALELPEIDVLLVGDGRRKSTLQNRVRTERISNVAFLDSMPKPELAKLLNACDVGVHCIAPLPLLALGMSPNKLFDYMAAGLPVVSNAREGLRAVVANGECGPIGDTRSLAAGLRAVRDATPEQRARWDARGQQIIRERYSRAAAARPLEAVLDATPERRTLPGFGTRGRSA